jgi:hypothetical protein
VTREIERETKRERDREKKKRLGDEEQEIKLHKPLRRLE